MKSFGGDLATFLNLVWARALHARSDSASSEATLKQITLQEKTERRDLKHNINSNIGAKRLAAQDKFNQNRSEAAYNVAGRSNVLTRTRKTKRKQALRPDKL